ncbi:phage tail protein [Pseudomonas sp. NPDC089734]|uniref:phage tail protein n=1 Tax=Pseudomonas sp. NPDC089734 TaxID=3364469 RepID=UPI00382099B5
MYAVLGTLEFEVASGITGMEQRGTADWAEHSLIQGKPLLEWIGEGLEELTFTMQLHPWLGDPEVRLRNLRELKAKHEPLAFVLGSGDYIGAFVITDISNVPKRTSSDGRVFSSAVQVGLREYAGPFKPKVFKPGLVESALTNTSASKIATPAVVSKFAPLLTKTQQVIGYARTAGNMIKQAKNIYDAVKNFNPMTLLTQAPQMAALAERALGPIAGLTEAASYISEGQDIVQMSQGLYSDVANARSSLSPLDLDSVADRFKSSGNYITQAYDKFDGASTRLSGLAAQVITRRA